MESIKQIYASALFELSQEKDEVDIYLNDIENIRQVLADNEELLLLLKNSQLSKHDKKDLLEPIFKPYIDASTYNFIQLLVDKGRINDLYGICEEYKKIYQKAFNIQSGTVYSTVLLDQEALETIAAKMSKKLNSKVILDNIIDESLIAGIKIVINDLIIDGSYATQIENMKKSINHTK